MESRKSVANGRDSESRGVGRLATDRAYSLRHFGISVAAIVAYAMRRELVINSTVLWLLGVAALANLALAALSDVRTWFGAARMVSPLLGLVSWSALVFSTGGVGSPFVAGFGLEILLSVLLVSPLGTLWTTGGAVLAIWITRLPVGSEPVLARLIVESTFVATIGLLASTASRRWLHSQEELDRETHVLGQRLRAMESEVETAIKLGRVGERAAWLAHGLKGAVRNLRGFSKLIELPSNANTRREALAGLQHAIDRLEELACETLAERAEVGKHVLALQTDVARTVDDVIAEMSRLHAAVRWVKPALESIPGVGVPAPLLREILLILAQNAAEATGQGGEVELYARVEDRILCLGVRDNGPGFPKDVSSATLRAGVTTKLAGSGFGLVLARRLVEARGGKLSIARAEEGGARVAVHLPLQVG